MSSWIFRWFTRRRGMICDYDPDVPGSDMGPLFETILKQVPRPEGETEGPLQLLLSNIDYDDYVGRIGIGRIERGTIRHGQQAVLCKTDGTTQHVNIGRLYEYQGLKRVETKEAGLGIS